MVTSCRTNWPKQAAIAALLLSACTALAQKNDFPAAQAAELIQEGKYNTAETLLVRATVDKSADAETYYRLGQVELKLGEPEKAATALEKAVSLDPKQARYHHELGEAYGQAATRASIFSALSVAKQCIASFEKAEQLDTNNIAYRKSCYAYYRASPSIAGGGREKASAEVTEIEKRDPVQGGGLRADLAVKDNKITEAFHIINELKIRFADNKVVLFYTGQIAVLSGQHLEDGEAALKIYLDYQPAEFEPQLWEAHWQLGQIAEKKKAKEIARQEYQETLRLNPGFCLAQIALKKL